MKSDKPAQDNTLSEHPPSVEVPPGSSCRRVLLVDDNQDVARSLARLVRSLGHEVRVSFSAQNALQVAECFRPQVILMDINLPDVSGYDAARALRAKPWRKDVLVVAVTGRGRERDREHAYEAGFDRHLTKPVDVDVIEALLVSP